MHWVALNLSRGATVRDYTCVLRRPEENHGLPTFAVNRYDVLPRDAGIVGHGRSESEFQYAYAQSSVPVLTILDNVKVISHYRCDRP